MATSPEHEAIVALFQNRPTLAVEILRGVPGAELPAFVRATVRNAVRLQAPTASHEADAVVALEGPEHPVAAVIIEVQNDRDAEKRFTWPLYVASVRQELKCPTLLLVVTRDEGVGRWAREPIFLGHPGFALAPIVLSPSGTPVITDPDVARADPELAVLSALMHGEGEHGYEVAVAALAGFEGVDPKRSDYYTTIVFGAVADTLRRRLEEEEMLKLETPEIVKRRQALRAEAAAEGKAEGKAESVLTVLATRGLTISEDARARILACHDLILLDEWLARAVTVAHAEELFENGAA